MKQNKVIKLTNATIYQRQNRILANVNLEVDEGEFVYVIGKVGTGKTSLIKTLIAELPLISGEGVVAGFRLDGIKRKEVALLRRRVGVVFQDFRLLTDRTVAQNLAFVLRATGWKNKNEIDTRIAEVLENVGVPDKKDKMPHELSGGEQQRVVIARAILNNPVLILADEPTGNLDPETSEEILNLFFGLNKEGKTVLMASHDYAVIAKNPARTLVCTQNKISDTEEFPAGITVNLFDKITSKSSTESGPEIDFENLLDVNEE
ncbi:MAG: ATP-binding cassette domain-containing protein [Prolixibacteraceae bacterium]|nr:ATP-binding cassette domain-containing protein [Prolixibacteraceae bacterium]